MGRTRLACALLLALAPSCLAAAAHAADAEPVLERVLLSTGGVGWFGYRAMADGDGTLRLTVPLTQVDDILKSLTILGDAGATVRSVSLPGPAPLADAFRSAPFGEGDLADLPTLLAALRGTTIEVRGPTSIRGRVLSVAAEETVVGGTGDTRTTVQHRLSMLAADGIRSVILEQIDGLVLQEPGLADKLQLVLARLADRQRDQERELVVTLGGGGGAAAGRAVTLGYLAEMPLWKASYRLIAGESEALLQGWAILENLSGRDWTDVAVTLVAGSPKALRQALFQSYFVARPEVPVVAAGGLTAPGGGEPSAKVPAMAPFAARSGVADEVVAAAEAAPAPLPPPAGLETAGSQELTAQTLFQLPQPVTLRDGHTVMAPIVDRNVPVERLALYRAAERSRHPRAALRLRNATGASLPAGLATLYERVGDADGGLGGLTYLGDAPLPLAPPDARKVLDYGIDGNIDVDASDEVQARLDRARIVDGVLEMQRVEQRRTSYRVSAAPFSGGQPRAFVLEQPLMAAWRVAEPADAEVDGGTVRVTRSLASGGKLEIVVVLERPRLERVALVDADAERLLLEFRGASPQPEVRAAIERLGALSARLGEIDREIGQATTGRDELVAEQERLRANLEAVPRDSDLARRYLDRLSAQEDELAEIARRLDQLREARERADQERRSFVRSLDII